jgi:hypothetical protein
MRAHAGMDCVEVECKPACEALLRVCQARRILRPKNEFFRRQMQC